MKCSIITLHAVFNYGSALQTYAMQYVIQRFGYDVEVVDYRRKALRVGSIKQILSNNDFDLKMKIKLILILPSWKRSKMIFDSFLKKYINLTPVVYHDECDFIMNPIEADVYCTGSDQVWNTGWHHEIPRPFFLSYAPEKSHMISFSASFGKEVLDDWEKPEIKKLLQRYKFISVRESSGVQILNDLGITECEHVLDPTLTVEPSVWYELASPRIVKDKYILVYQLNSNKQFDRYVKKFAKIKGLKLIRLCVRYDQIRKTGHGMVLPQVEEFLALFRDAEYVVTDSFHATAYSLIFHKKFVDIYPKLFSARLESVLKLTGLQERHLTDFSDFTVIDREIDYSMVDNILECERKKTMAFLLEALSIDTH